MPAKSTVYSDGIFGGGYSTVYKASSFLMTAEVNSEVVAEPRRSIFSWDRTDSTVDYSPPISAVRTTPLLMTSKVAEAMLFARLSRLQKIHQDMTSARGMKHTQDASTSSSQRESWPLG